MDRERLINYMKIAGGVLLGLTVYVAVESVGYLPFGIVGLLNDTPENRQKATETLNRVLTTPGAKILCRANDTAEPVRLDFLRETTNSQTKGRTMLENQLRNGWCLADFPKANP